MSNNVRMQDTQSNDQNNTEDMQGHDLSPSPVKVADHRKIFVKGQERSRVHYNPSEAPHFEEGHAQEQETLVLKPSNAQPIKAKRSFLFRAAQTLGILGSLAWAVICLAYFTMEGGFARSPYDFGVFMTGVLAPVAFYWMLLSYLQRNSDVQYYAESLKSELHTLFFPSEEDSKRVNKDIERMTAQAAELAASSKAALKAIQRTRQGLHHEIKEFASLARKAEGHLLSLSDGLVERSGSVGEIVDMVDGRISIIHEKSQNAIIAWDEASAKMVERASDVETSMDNGAQRILSMANVAEEKSKTVSEMFDGTITSLGLTVDAVIDRLGGMNEEFVGHTRTLQVSAEDLARETGRLGEMIGDQIEQLEDATGRSVESITQSLVSMSQQHDNIEETTSTLNDRIEIISSTVSKSLEDMDATTNSILDKVSLTEERLEERSSAIATTLDGFAGQIDRIDSLSDLATHRLGEGIESAVNGAEEVGSAVSRAPLK
jgi:predicted  nucleic acid-binding Zn-ribbon protein